MGKLSVDFDDDFMKKLSKLSDTDRYAPMMIDEALPILKNKLSAAYTAHKKSGDLSRSIRIRRAKAVKKGGYFGSAYPSGTDSNGVRNSEKAAYLEFGNKNGAVGMNIIAKTTLEAQSEVEKKMEEVFYREAMNEK